MYNYIAYHFTLLGTMRVRQQSNRM